MGYWTMNHTANDTKNHMEEFNAKLKAFRAEIDALDEQLIQLILKRSAVVGQVGKLKANTKETACPLRPAREAAQLAKLLDRFNKEPFPAAAAVHIWRHIINGSLAIEHAMTIGVCSAVGAASDLMWMAREYFGAYTETLRESQPRALVNKVATGQYHIGILPYPAADDANPWWLDLAQEKNDSPKIFLQLPFLPEQPAQRSGGNHNHTRAFAIARLTHEPFGEKGVSALAMRTETTLSMSKLQDCLKRADLQAKWVCTNTLNEMQRAHFVEVDGDVTADDQKLEKLRELAGASLLSIAMIGHYAKPLIKEEH